nr:6679_t:CDS:2 [Entrophospora candida]CAG8569561.1 10568_t:CDS:2 [Entrophospora candida]
MEGEDIFKILLEISMVIGPVLGYFDQIAKFRARKSSLGYSLDTTGVLLVCKLGKKFDIVLLYQSILMIIVQLILLHQCLVYQYPIPPTSNRRWFWNWYQYGSYIIFLLSLTGILGIFYFLFDKDGVFIEILGYLSLGIESTVPMPQALVNFKYKSVSGFSRWILVTWFIGDSFKTFYYIFTTAPIQFIICGIIQLSVDGVIVLQFVIYGNNRINELIFGQNNNNYGYSRLADDRRTLSYNSLDEII